ncbi:hypothetical protein UQW22_06210 [Isoptericola halotolerans]|uniref:hypothetical protein n=1 Tax=Isoptericola halotolerans TaxID=300560 RepID=UPI00388F82F5
MGTDRRTGPLAAALAPNLRRTAAAVAARAARDLGAVLATVADPHLDLAAGDVVAQIAWTDHVLGDLLEVRHPGRRAVVCPLDGAPSLELTGPVDVTATTAEREPDDPMLRDVRGARLTRLDLDVTARRSLRVRVARTGPTSAPAPQEVR